VCSGVYLLCLLGFCQACCCWHLGGKIDIAYLKIRGGKKSRNKAKRKAEDENSTFIVNPLLFYMKDRFKFCAQDLTLQQALNYYNEDTIAEAKVLLHNKVALGKRLIKTKGERKAKETLKDISTMIKEMDADPSNSIRLVTSLDLKNVDATASLYHKILLLNKEVDQQRGVKNAAVMRISISSKLIYNPSKQICRLWQKRQKNQ